MVHPLRFMGEVLKHWIAEGPSNRFFSSLRWKVYRGQLREGSGRFESMTGLCIPCPAHVFIGEGVVFNCHVLVDACDGGSIHIGKNCLVGPFVVIRSADHAFADTSREIRDQGHVGGDIRIEDGCWIGSHVTITRDAVIGQGSVIGANSVVTRSVPPFSVAAGNPARVIRSRISGGEEAAPSPS